MNWRSIPDLFSNVMGQIVPGFIILVLLFATVFGPTEMLRAVMDPDTQGRAFSLGTIVVFVVLSQAVGMLAGQIWTSTIGSLMRNADARKNRELIEERLKDHNRILAALCHRPLAISPDDLPEPFIMHDHLHLVVPEVAARLLKARAERRNCHALGLGATLILLLNLYLLVHDASRARIGWAVVLLLMAVSCFLRSFRLVGMLTNGIVNTWLCQASAGTLPFQTSAAPGDKSSVDGERQEGVDQRAPGDGE